MIVVLIAIFVGAIIGAITNALAIKMLFRPFKPWKIGTWQIPFTPGLIPKRREEISEQLGRLVEDYLFTAKGLKNFFETSGIDKKVLEKLRGKITRYKHGNYLVGDVLNRLFTESWQENVERLSKGEIEKLLRNEEVMNKTLDDLLQGETIIIIDNKIEIIASIVIDEIKHYIQSYEGRVWVQAHAKQFLEGKRMLKFFTGILLEDKKFNDKVSSYLIEILNQRNTLQVVEGILLKKWEDLRNIPIEQIINYLYDNLAIDLDKILEGIVSNIGKIELKGLIYLIEDNNLIEKGYQFIIQSLTEKIERMFPYLSISQVVKEEVNRFSLEDLEKMILDVVSKELKMITYLGGVLGGLIGFLQGIMYQLF